MATTHQAVDMQSDPLSPDFVISNFEDALAWVRANNPGMAMNHPENLDWQAIKAEGRRS